MYLSTVAKTIFRHGVELNAEFSGELETMDCVGDDVRGVVCYSGSVAFPINGIEYYIIFNAAWFEDDTFDYWEEEDIGIRKASDSDEYLTAEEVTAIENAFGGAPNLYQALLDAMRAATEDAKPKAMEHLQSCIDNDEF